MGEKRTIDIDVSFLSKLLVFACTLLMSIATWYLKEINSNIKDLNTFSKNQVIKNMHLDKTDELHTLKIDRNVRDILELREDYKKLFAKHEEIYQIDKRRM